MELYRGYIGIMEKKMETTTTIALERLSSHRPREPNGKRRERKPLSLGVLNILLGCC